MKIILDSCVAVLPKAIGFFLLFFGGLEGAGEAPGSGVGDRNSSKSGMPLVPKSVFPKPARSIRPYLRVRWSCVSRLVL